MKPVPSKTFLFGEYVAMFGGPALIALTQPSFIKDETKSLHPKCMAAKLWQQQTGQPCRWGLDDPYQGKGGLGASSAEFLIAYRHFFDEKQLGLEHLHHTYLSFASTEGGQRPSGYDVLAQTGFACALVESGAYKVSCSPWPFKELGFILVHTNKKLATHQHLNDVSCELNWRSLMSGIELGCDAFLQTDCDGWLKATRMFHQDLLKQHLVASHSQQLLNDIHAHVPVLASKGCGAMGADVLALYVLSENVSSSVDVLKKKGFDVLATHQDLLLEAQNA